MMRERSRRQICRWAFVLFCAIPTCGTGSWAAYRLSPLYVTAERAAWEQALYLYTGLLATVQRVEHPAGGSTLLTDVVLVDPDGGDRVARLRQVEVDLTPQGIAVRLSQPEIAQGKFLRLWETLHDRVLRGPRSPRTIQLTCGELTLETGPSAQTFTRLKCTIEPYVSGVRALIEFQLAGLEMPFPASLRIERNHQMIPPATSWQLNTATAIPCQLFSDYLPVLGKVGRDSGFRGTVAATVIRGAWSARLSGQFSLVDLRMLTDQFDHPLTGVGQVDIERAIIQGGALVEAVGRVASAGGSVSSSLLVTLAEKMNLAIPPGLKTAAPANLTYSEMAFHFTLDAQGLTLAGCCGGNASGILLSSATSGILGADSRRFYSVIALFQALLPPSDWSLPATAESTELLRHVALPPRTRNANAIAQQPWAPRLRMREPQTDEHDR